MAITWNTVEVRGRIVQLDGTPVTGKISFTATADRLKDVEDLHLILGRRQTLILDATGAFKINLPATDDPDVLGGPFTYHVVTDFEGGGGWDFYMEVPLANQPTGMDISSVSPAQPPTEELVTYVTQEQLAALPKMIVLADTDPIPPGTTSNTLILRK